MPSPRSDKLIAEFPDIQIAVVTEFDLASKAADGIIETEGDCHAGEIETSRILHTHPHLVKGDGKRERPNFPDGILVRNKRKFWPDGVWGDPTKASAEKGKRLEEIVVKRIVELAKRMEGFDEQPL